MIENLEKFKWLYTDNDPHYFPILFNIDESKNILK